MLTTFGRLMADDRLRRRRDNRVISCLLCGDTLAIFEEGGRVPPTPHCCSPAVEYYDLADCLAEQQATRKPDE